MLKPWGRVALGFLLSLTLLTAYISRSNAFSLGYMLLWWALLSTFSRLSLVSSERSPIIKAHQVVLLVVLVYSILIVAAQGGFQIYLENSSPYGSALMRNSTIGRRIFQVGLYSFEGASVAHVLLGVLPDALVFICAVLTYALSKREQEEAHQHPRKSLSDEDSVSTNLDVSNLSSAPSTSSFDPYAGVSAYGVVGFVVDLSKNHYVFLLSLALAGLSFPSITSSVYVIAFLGIVIYWCAKCQSIATVSLINLTVLRRVLSFYVCFHSLLLFMYQFPFFQFQYPHLDYLGLIPFVIPDHEDYIRTKVNATSWAYYLHIASLVFLNFALLMDFQSSWLTLFIKPLKVCFKNRGEKDDIEDVPLIPPESMLEEEDSSEDSSLRLVFIALSNTFFRNFYLLSMLALLVWAFSFPSWFGFTYLCWTLICIFVKKKLFLNTLWLVMVTTLGNFIVEFVFCVSKVSGKSQINWEERSEGLQFVYLISKLSIFSILCINYVLHKLRPRLHHRASMIGPYYSPTNSVSSRDQLPKTGTTRPNISSPLHPLEQPLLSDTSSIEQIDETGLGGNLPPHHLHQTENDVFLPSPDTPSEVYTPTNVAFSVPLENDFEMIDAPRVQEASFGVYVFQQIKAFVVNYSYFLVSLVVFLAALESVNLFNAGYLVFTLTFWVFPTLCHRFWWTLVVYTSMVLVLKYISGFPCCKPFSDSTSTLIGIGNDSLRHVWNEFRWDFMIYVLSAIQYKAWRLIDSQNREDFEEKNLNILLQYKSAHSATLDLIQSIFVEFFIAVAPFSFLFHSLFSSVSVISMAYLFLFFLMSCFFLLGIPILIKRTWILCILYCVFVPVLTYIYQFDGVQTEWKKYMSTSALEDIGFRVDHGQIERFRSLAPQIGLLVLSIVWAGLYEPFKQTKRASLILINTYRETMFMMWVKKVGLFFQKLLILQIESITTLLVFTAVLSPDVGAIDLVTIVLLFLRMILASKKTDYVLTIVLCIYLMLVVLLKLAVQLKNVTLPLSKETQAWVGLNAVPDPFAFVVWYVVAILGLLMYRFVWSWTRSIFPPGTEHLLFGVPREEQYSSLWCAIGFTIDHFMKILGLELCYLAGLLTALVRLNFVSLLYLALTAFLIRTKRRVLRKFWPMLVALLSILLGAQYISDVGLPPSMEYVYSNWTYAHEDANALMRWLYFPPVDNSDSRAPVVLDRAPPIWSSSEALLADFAMLFISCLVLRAFRADKNAGLAFARVTSVEGDPIAPPDVLPLRTIGGIYLLHWSVLFFALLAAISRQDVFCLGYFFISFNLLSKFQEIFSNPRKSGKLFSVLTWYNFAIICYHVCWTLPLVLLRWPHLDSSLVDLLNFFGVRYGQDVKPLPSDVRVSVWSADYGLLFDVFLFILLSLQRKVLETKEMEIACTMHRADLNEAKERASRLSSVLKHSYDTRKQEEKAEVEFSSTIVAAIKERMTNHEGMPIDRSAALWFVQWSMRKKQSLEPPLRSFLSSPLPQIDETEEEKKLDEAYEKVTEDEDGAEGISTPGPDAHPPVPIDPFLEEKEELQAQVDTAQKAALPAYLVWIEEKLRVLSQQLVAVLWKSTGFYRRFFHEEEHITSKNIFIQLVEASYFFVLANTQWLCYLMIILNAVYNANLLSMAFPCLFLSWGIISNPFPTYRFWNFLIIYTEVVLVGKYFFQFTLWGDFNRPISEVPGCAQVSEQTQSTCLAFPYVLGIDRKSDKPLFHTHLLMDVFVLLSLFLHRASLQRLGVWGYDAYSSLSGGLAKRDSVPVLFQSGEHKKVPFHKKIVHFFHHLLDERLAYPRDLYSFMFGIEFVSLLVIALGWSAFQNQTSDYGVSNAASIIESNNIPGVLLVAMLLQFTLILVDRIIYIQRWLKVKLVLHYILIFIVHLLVFYIIPATTMRPFSQNPTIMFWYALKLVYLLLSGAQISAHYPNHVFGSDLMKNHSNFGSILVSIYLAIPFLFELRVLLDWTSSATSLKLWQWFKLEDIVSELYFNKVEREGDKTRKIGDKQPFSTKLFTGALFLFGLVFLIWFPLLIISLVRAADVSNPPTMVSVTLGVNAYEPFYTSRAYPRALTASEYEYLKKLDNSGFVKQFKLSDIQVHIVSPEPRSMWAISPSTRAELNTTLHTSISTLRFGWTFSRDPLIPGVVTQSVGSTLQVFPPNSTEIHGLIHTLSAFNTSSRLGAVFPSFYHLDATGVTKPYDLLPPSLKALPLVNCSLLHESNADGSQDWWSLAQTSKHVLPSDNVGNSTLPNYPNSAWLELITFSDRIANQKYSFFSSYGIVGLYISIVLVVGRFLRMIVNKISHRIIYEEMPFVDAIQNVCYLVALCREFGHLEMEEYLFRVLIELYRSPEAIRVWTNMDLKQE